MRPTRCLLVVQFRLLTPVRTSILTAAKDRKSNDLSFKSASLDQFWSCLQRCLLFEEPSSRWSKLVSQVGRLANGKTKDLANLPLSVQQNCFASVFGTPEDLLDPTARMFNLVLTMQDLKQFEAADFDLWFFSQGNEESTGEFEEIFSQIAESVLGCKPEPAQVASLVQAWNVVPYWRLLESFGPWSDDLLADFVATVLNRFDKMRVSLQLDLVQLAQREFLKKLAESRPRLPANFQPTLLVLVEGNTESILLSKFLSLSKRRPADLSVMFIPCGGANQLLRKYLHLRDITKLPIVCVMDCDAEEQTATIRDVLRDSDRLHTWSAGEIEDTFTREALFDSLNGYLQSLGTSELLMIEDLDSDIRRTSLLDKLWRDRGLGDFDKVGFAEFQVQRLKSAQDIPEEGKRLMQNILSLATGKNA